MNLSRKTMVCELVFSSWRTSCEQPQETKTRDDFFDRDAKLVNGNETEYGTSDHAESVVNEISTECGTFYPSASEIATESGTFDLSASEIATESGTSSLSETRLSETCRQTDL